MKPGVLGLAMFFGLGMSAFASSVNVNFTFDAQTINGTNISALASGATSAQIATYMTSVLAAWGCSGCGVTVLTSGSSIGAVADRTYSGDGFAVGVGSGASYQAVTLGTTNGAVNNNAGTSASPSGNGALNSTTPGTYDTFIANTNDSSGTVSNQITLQFTGFAGKSLTINGFNYEIFPDGTCTALTSSGCGGTSSSTPSGFANQPDLEFEAGNNTNGTDTLQDTFWGVTPGSTTGTLETGSSLSQVVATGSDGTSTKSSACTSNDLQAGCSTAGGGTTTAPQAIGSWSGSLTNATELDFVDWPATVGIDNLQISFSNTSPVPEPAGIALIGTIVLLTTRKLRRKSS